MVWGRKIEPVGVAKWKNSAGEGKKAVQSDAVCVEMGMSVRVGKYKREQARALLN